MKEVAEELDNFLPRPAHQPIRNVAKGSTEPISHHSAEFSSGQRLLTPD